MAPSPYIFIISIGPVDMNKYARFDEIPSRTLKNIKETKRYGRTDGRTDGWTDNVKTVYPPTNTVCGGYKIQKLKPVTIFCGCTACFVSDLVENLFSFFIFFKGLI